MTRKQVIGAALVVAALAVGGVLYSLYRPSGAAAPSSAGTVDASAPRYHCPMHPTMVSDRPGDCPICGMRMVPIESGKDSVERGSEDVGDSSAAGGDAAVEGRAPVKLSAQKRQLIAVRTAPVEKGPFVRTIRTVGRVTYDETRLHSVTTKVSGWVERLYASTTGELVKEGEPLLTIYSPELVASAQEYLLARRASDQLAGSELAGTSGERLLASARRRLILFDLTPQQIAELEKTGEAPTTMTLHAPIGGHIIARNVTQGDRTEPGTKLLDIAELSRVWVLADIYEYELPFVHVGQAATMTLSYLPARTFEGRIMLIHPMVSETTRTVKVHIELSNPDFALKPEMYAQVEIRSDLGERLTVPESAVISTGTRDIAFVDRGEGYLEPRDLKLGVRLPDRFEVLEGLAEGERVLTSGNFLVDSESKLKAALAAVGTGEAGATSEKKPPRAATGAGEAGGASGHSH